LRTARYNPPPVIAAIEDACMNAPSASVLALVAASLPPLAMAASPAFPLVALGPSNTLTLFRSDAPGSTQTIKVSAVDGTVIGVDVRSADGKLYAITTTDALYTIDPRTGAATAVSKLGSPFGGGPASAFDFNPQADRLRVIGPAGQNLRINVQLGAVAIDGTLNYAADDNHAGKRPRVSATAYTNAVPRARSTTMFNLDYGLDVLVRQEPPNDGVLTTVGPLGVDCGEAAGFDIATDADGTDHAFAICSKTLYRVDLESGAARALGAIDATESRFLGLAVLPDTHEK
jgi:hypothetical protein